MNVEPVTEYALKEIASWFDRRGLHRWPAGWLSDLGFWVPGLAAGWLVTTNSGRALIEDFVSNPNAQKAQSREAADLLARHVEAVARDLGFLYLVGTTELETVRASASRFGYTVTAPKFSFLFKDLAK